MTLAKRYTASSHCVYNLGYHLIWCPKYRRKVLINGIDERLKILLTEKAKELDIEIKKMEVMPDHVHVFVKAKPIYQPHFIVQQFKGYSSRILRKEFVVLRKKLPTLWTRSYFCESVGNISEKTILKYIENQKNV